jgi:YHS domain-containing protein
MKHGVEGVLVPADQAEGVVASSGGYYGFCSAGCASAFATDPSRYESYICVKLIWSYSYPKRTLKVQGSNFKDDERRFEEVWREIERISMSSS